MRKFMILGLLIAWLVAAVPSASAGSATLRLAFIAESLSGPGQDTLTLRIVDAGSIFPGKAVLEIRLLRLVPALHAPGSEQAAGSQDEIEVSTAIARNTACGFSLEQDLASAGGAYPPGTYIIEIGFFRGQRAELETLLRDLPEPVTARRTFTLGTPRDALAAIATDIARLDAVRDGLEETAHRLDDALRTMCQSEPSQPLWESLTNGFLPDYIQAVSHVRYGTMTGMMADAYVKTNYLLDEYLQQQLGRINFILGGPGADQDGASLKNSGDDATILDPALALAMYDGEMLRQIPMHVAVALDGAAESLLDGRANQPAASGRELMDEIHHPCVKFLTDIAAIYEQRCQSVRDLEHRVANAADPGWSDKPTTERMRKDLLEFLQRMRTAPINAAGILNDLAEQFTQLQAELDRAAAEGKTADAMRAAVAPRLAAIRDLRAQLNSWVQYTVSVK